MIYAFLLHGDEAADQALSDDERRDIVAAHEAFRTRLRDRGVLVQGVGLSASASAAVVRRGPGDLVVDGPFAESREQLGGIYLVECADRDEAVALAREVPMSPGLSVEVRPAF